MFTEFYDRFVDMQLKSVIKIMKVIEEVNKPCFIIHGNADTLEVREYIRKRAKDNSNIYFLDNEAVTFNNFIIAGYGYTSPNPVDEIQAPGVKTLKEIKADIKELSEQIEKFSKSFPDLKVIGLFHDPPYNTALDYIKQRNEHVGNKIILDHVKSTPYSFFFAGHIHESRAIEFTNNSIRMNPGPLINGMWAHIDLNNPSNFKLEKSKFMFSSILHVVYKLRGLFK